MLCGYATSFQAYSASRYTMRRLFLNAGPIAHLSPSGFSGALTGDVMSDENALIHPSGRAILTSDSKIESIADSEELQAEYSPDVTIGNAKPTLLKNGKFEVWDLAGQAVIPGLVDGHNHLIWTGDRSNEVALREQGYSYREISDMGGGINKTVRETREASHNLLLQEGLKRVNTAQQFGSTFLETKSGYGLTVQDELKILDVSNQLGEEKSIHTTATWLGAHSVPKGMTRSQYVEQLLSEQLPAVVEQGIATYADVFCEDGWFTLEETEDICKAAKSEGLEIRLHVDEFADCGGAQLAAELGALTADHAGWSSDSAREACHKSGVIQGFLPSTPHVLGLDHWPPFQKCIDNDWAWSLATDFNPNCPSLSLPFSAQLAMRHSSVSSLSALVASSRNSAASLVEGQGTGLGMIIEGGPSSLNILSSKKVTDWCNSPDLPFAATLSNGEWVNSL